MRRLLGWILPIVLIASCARTVPAPPDADPVYKILVFSKTSAFRHGSIPNGIAAIQALGAANNFTVDATEDAGAFTTANLAQYQAVVWLSTTGDVLDDTQQTAFQSYIRAGGGYAGIHAAADTEYAWPWYGGLVGAYFSSHPADQQATVRVEDRANPSTAHLAPTWTRTDEWYNYATNPRATVKVLTSLDESTYTGGTMGADHPNTWCQNYDGGRSWYTGMGHFPAAYTDPAFTGLLLGGIQYAAGAVHADCRPETGYTALFDGTQASLDRWHQAGPGGFTLAGPPAASTASGRQTPHCAPPTSTRIRQDGGTQPPTDLAHGKVVTVSSVEPGSPHVGGNAVDGNSATRWGSAYSDPQWITTGLGVTRVIDRVRLSWEAAYGRAYQIQTSPDNAGWTTVYSTTSGDGGIDDIDLSGSGRYVRVDGTQRGLTRYGDSLWALEIYGT